MKRADLRARLAEPAPPPREATLEFLHGYVTHAESLDEVREQAVQMRAVNRRPLERGLAGIEGLLAQESPEGDLAQLVAWEANWVLDDPSDVGARAFLAGLAGLLREVLAGG